MKRKPHILDIGSAFTAGLTLVLFLTSLAIKGLTHEMLLETAVFLVSMKLIIATAKGSITQKEMNRKLDLIQENLDQKESAEKKAA